MRRLVLAIVIAGLLLGGYTGLSYWGGMQAEGQYHLLLPQISRADQLDVSSKTYERGVFTSRAVTSVVMKRHGRDPVEFSLTHSIHHGPLAFVSNPHLKGPVQPVLALIWTRFSPGAENSEQIRKLLDAVPELGASEFLTVLSLDGSGESYLDIPPFIKTSVGQEEKEADINWGGFSFNADFKTHSGEMSGAFSAPSLEILEKEGRLRVREFKGEFSSHKGIRDVSVGSASVTVGSVELIDTQKGTARFLIRSPSIHTSAAVSGETIDSSLRMGFEKVSVAEEAFGPLAFEFEARRLDPDVLAKIPRFSADMSARLESGSEEDIKGVLSSFYSNLLIDLLARSPEFELKRLDFRTGKGDFKGKAALAFAGPAPAGNIFALLQGMSASIDLSISEALFSFIAEIAMRGEAGKNTPHPADLEKSARQSAQELSDLLLSQNIAVREGGALKSSASYKQGRLTLNGKKIQASDLFKLTR